MPNFKPRILAATGENGKPVTFKILCIREGAWEKTGPHGLPVYSTAESLQAAAPLFKDLPVMAYQFVPGLDAKEKVLEGHTDHLPDEVKYAAANYGLAALGNIVGYVRNPRYESVEGGDAGIVAEWEITDPALGAALLSQWEKGVRDFPGFSIDGSPRWNIIAVENEPYDGVEIVSLDSLDIVTYPAAGGGVLRLAASRTSKGDSEMKLTARQRATMIAVLVAAGVGDEILNNLISSAPDAFINRGRELLAKERDFLAKFDDTLQKFEKGEEVKVASGTGEFISDLKAVQDKAVADAKAADEKAAAEKAAAEAAAKVKDDPAVQQANAILDQAKKMNEATETRLGEATIEEEVRVNASHFPDAARDELKKRLKASRVYDPAKIKTEIDTMGKFLSDVSGDDRYRGQRVNASVTSDERDNHLLAVQGMLAGHAIKNKNGTLISPFRNFREMNERITGSRYDQDLQQVWKKMAKLGAFDSSDYYDPITRKPTDRLLAALTTSDLGEIFGVAMHKQMIDDYNAANWQDWRKIVKVVSLDDLYTLQLPRIGGYAAAPSISEGGTYTEVTSPADEQASLSLTKYGDIESVTEEMVINNDLFRLQQLTNALGEGMAIDVYRMVFDILINNEAVAYGSDTNTLVHAAHANGSASGGSALSATTWASSFQRMIQQAAFGASRNVLGLRNSPRYIVCGPASIDTAVTITNPERLVQSAAASDQYANGYFMADTGVKNRTWNASCEPILVPYMTTSANWWNVADPLKRPGIVVGFLNGKDTPELVAEAAATGSDFTADKKRLKRKMRRGYAIYDHRSIDGQLA